MTQRDYDGQMLKRALKSAERLLEKRIDELNALNVFPVPDGDTGINMYLTAQSATAAAEPLTTNSVAEITAKVARGALLGARGNSGVILSQILRGIAKGMEMKERFSAFDFAQALRCASDTAYKSVLQPVEGTILTVIREASEVAMQQVERGANLKQTMSKIVSRAHSTVIKTPELLPKLREAGVVDAGGKGLYYVFLGMKNFLFQEITLADKRVVISKRTKSSQAPQNYGFDLQFLVDGEKLVPEEMQQKISSLGESVLVVGDETLIRVHVHTKEPRLILDYSASKGFLRDIKLEDLDRQVAKFREIKAKSGKNNRDQSDYR